MGESPMFSLNGLCISKNQAGIDNHAGMADADEDELVRLLQPVPLDKCTRSAKQTNVKKQKYNKSSPVLVELDFPEKQKCMKSSPVQVELDASDMSSLQLTWTQSNLLFVPSQASLVSENGDQEYDDEFQREIEKGSRQYPLTVRLPLAIDSKCSLRYFDMNKFPASAQTPFDCKTSKFSENKSQCTISSPVLDELQSSKSSSLGLSRAESKLTFEPSVSSKIKRHKQASRRLNLQHPNCYPLAVRLPLKVDSNCSLRYFDMDSDSGEKNVRPVWNGSVVCTNKSEGCVLKKACAKKECELDPPFANKKQGKPFEQLRGKQRLRLQQACSKKKADMSSNLRSISHLQNLSQMKLSKYWAEVWAFLSWLMLVLLLLCTLFYRSVLEKPCICS